MRKKAVLGWLLAALFCLMPSMMIASGQSRSTMGKILKQMSEVVKSIYDLPADSTTITVSRSVYYSPSKNAIYIKEGEHVTYYTVQVNPQYGQNSAQGKYRYQAGNYYFDL